MAMTADAWTVSVDWQRRSFYIAVQARGTQGEHSVAPAWFKAVTDRLRGGGESGRAQREAQRTMQRRAGEFRAEAQAAIEQALARGDRAPLETLLRKPADVGLPEDDVELELEALHGALDAIGLRETVARDGLPVVEHQHKALGGDRCHFRAAVFLASDGSDRTGRLFLTDRRVLFLSAPLVSLSWGGVASVEADQRDLLIASTSRGVLYRFRCNSFSDARCAEVIARAIKSQPGAYSSPPDSSVTAGDGPPGSR
jgi:hypothetical protein